jgi:hypothetical protein
MEYKKLCEPLWFSDFVAELRNATKTPRHQGSLTNVRILLGKV